MDLAIILDPYIYRIVTHLILHQEILSVFRAKLARICPPFYIFFRIHENISNLEITRDTSLILFFLEKDKIPLIFYNWRGGGDRRKFFRAQRNKRLVYFRKEKAHLLIFWPLQIKIARLEPCRRDPCIFVTSNESGMFNSRDFSLSIYVLAALSPPTKKFHRSDYA